MLQDILRIFPLGQVQVTVAAHYQDKLVIRVFFMKIGQGICGIGGFGQFEFDITGPEVFLSLNRELYQVKTVVFI